MPSGVTHAWLVAIVVLVSACSESEPVDGVAPCEPPNRQIDIGDCVAPGVGDDGCPAGTLAQGEQCVAAGVPPEHCAEGFVPKEDGCEPLLPAEPCGPGSMAVPGETRCRAVANCASGTWGDIVTDASTQHVDASFSGATSDGSATEPWRTIGEAVSAATPGAVIAIAPGVYLEDILLSGKPVRLWGVCPDLVELRGSGSAIASLDMRSGATSSEVHRMAISGGRFGIGISGAEDVLIERVWIHDTDAQGIDVEDTLGPSSANIVGSLVEAAVEVGVFVAGAPVTMDSSVVRGTLPRADMAFGRGLGVQRSMDGLPAKVTLARSVMERNHELGAFCGSSELTVDSTVVRSTASQVSDGLLGVGIGAASISGDLRGRLTVRGSWLAENHSSGIAIEDTDVVVEDSVIRGTLPTPAGEFGHGINLRPTGGPPATLNLRSSVVAENHAAGVLISGANATIEGAVIRDTSPQPAGDKYGRGLGIQDDTVSGARSAVTVRGSLVARNHDVGVFVAGSAATIEATVVRDTLTASASPGRGINVEDDGATGNTSSLLLVASLLERNVEAGVVIIDSHAEIETTIVRDTAAAAGVFGDGVITVREGANTSLALSNALVEKSARAGVAVLGGAFATLGNNQLRCNLMDLVASQHHEASPTLSDRGNNSCGCAEPLSACRAVSASVDPPAPLEETAAP